MKNRPGTLQEGGAPFYTTHWSVVVQAMESQPPASVQQALGDFCQAYWPPLYTFVRRRGYAPADAQDLVQGFFAHLLAEDTLSRADREKGRLRTFLLGAFQRYLASEYGRVHTLKRGAGQQIVSMDDGLAGAAEALLAVGDLNDVNTYDRTWVQTLVDRAWERLQNEFAVESKASLLNEIKPFLLGGTELTSQEEVAVRLEMPFATLRTVLRRARLRYRNALRDEVARTTTDPAQVDEEMRYLYQLLLD